MMTNEELSAYVTQLKTAVDNNDHGEFKLLVAKIHGAIPALVKFRARGKLKPVTVIKSAINKEPVLALKDTPAANVDMILTKTNKASARWYKSGLAARIRFLDILQRKMVENAYLFEVVLTLDTGKTLHKNAKDEFKKALKWFAWPGQKPEILIGLKPLVTLLDKTGSVIDQQTALSNNFAGVATAMVEGSVPKPVGTFAVITSYNYPMALSIAGIFQALLTGNSVIFKPSQKAPVWAFVFKEIFDDAMAEWAETSGVKPIDNLFRIIVGYGADIREKAGGLFFVGSKKTGNSLKKIRGCKPTVLELGGNSAVTLMASAVETAEDIKKITGEIFMGANDMAGQRCTAARRLLVDKKAPKAFINALREIYENPPHIGNPFDGETVIGALVEETALKDMETALKNAENIKGLVVTGGGRVGNNTSPHGGIYVYPALFDWTAVDLEVNRAAMEKIIDLEIFAPVLHYLKRVKNVEEAIEITNRDPEKLAASIYTRDNDEWNKFAGAVHVGSITRNKAPGAPDPFGGHGNFGETSRSGGAHGLTPFLVAARPEENIVVTHSITTDRDRAQIAALLIN